jgi:hypothetical protein
MVWRGSFNEALSQARVSLNESLFFNREVTTMKSFNVESLQKGDYLSPTEIEEIIEEVEGTREYQFALMQLRQEIEHGLLCLSRPATIKTEGSGLRVLTDPEAAVYNARHGNLARFKLFRAFRRNQAVDEAKLTDPERQVHYRTLEVQGKYVQALKQISREVAVEPVKRLTPGIVSMAASTQSQT